MAPNLDRIFSVALLTLPSVPSKSNTLMTMLNQSDNQLTIFHGSSPPYTSENNSLSSHRLRDSARLNEVMTLARSRDFNCSSSAFHQPRDSMNSRKRVMGLSIFFRSSTSDRARYAKESSDVEWCPTLYRKCERATAFPVGESYRYVMASISTARPCSKHRLLASLVAARTARTSFPSTRIVSMP